MHQDRPHRWLDFPILNGAVPVLKPIGRLRASPPANRAFTRTRLRIPHCLIATRSPQCVRPLSTIQFHLRERAAEMRVSSKELKDDNTAAVIMRLQSCGCLHRADRQSVGRTRRSQYRRSEALASHSSRRGSSARCWARSAAIDLREYLDRRLESCGCLHGADQQSVRRTSGSQYRRSEALASHYFPDGAPPARRSSSVSRRSISTNASIRSLTSFSTSRPPCAMLAWRRRSMMSLSGGA